MSFNYKVIHKEKDLEFEVALEEGAKEGRLIKFNDQYYSIEHIVIPDFESDGPGELFVIDYGGDLKGKPNA